MTKYKMPSSFLTADERQYYENYRSEDIHTMADNDNFRNICRKMDEYRLDMVWIRKLAWQVVREVDPQQYDLALDSLHSALVWGKTH